ncbi:MAG: hypothetical protein ACI9C2_001794 [Gammaproteobacteria bacterium]
MKHDILSSLLLCLLLTAAAPFAQAGENRLSYGRISLEGNIESVVLDFGPLGQTRIGGDGDAQDAVLSRTFTGATISIPIPLGADRASALVPTVTTTGGGEVRYLGWERAVTPLPSELALRSLPPVERPLPRPSVMGLLLLALGCSGTWLLLRSQKPRLALALATISAASLATFSGSLMSLDVSQRMVVDFAPKPGQPDSWQGIQTNGAAESIEFGPGTQTLEVVPEHSPLELVLPLESILSAGGIGAQNTGWRATAPRASRSWTRGKWGGSTGEWLGRNTTGDLRQSLGDFRSTWLRSPSSEIEARGAMPAEQPATNPPSDQSEPPPSWLVAGLPMGRAAFLGRLDGAKVWVRATWDGL